MKTLGRVLLASATAAALCLAPAGAKEKEKDRKSDPGPHPLKIWKVVQDTGSVETSTSTRGAYDIWLSNVTDVAVDKITIEMDLYNRNGRIVQVVKKDIGTLDASHKWEGRMKYEVVNERSLKPRFWVTYNAGKEKPVQFEVSGTQQNW